MTEEQNLLPALGKTAVAIAEFALAVGTAAAAFNTVCNAADALRKKIEEFAEEEPQEDYIDIEARVAEESTV